LPGIQIKLLVVIDPRKSETAEIADIHLPIKPGTDALLTKAMISIVINEGWVDEEYIKNHVSGYEAIKGWFKDFDAKSAVEFCGLDYSQVRDLCKELRVRKSAYHPDLGVYMNRHSTLYLLSSDYIVYNYRKFLCQRGQCYSWDAYANFRSQ
jgi:anaerobic selenocysteine-containing dehydrogenase